VSRRNKKRSGYPHRCQRRINAAAAPSFEGRCGMPLAHQSVRYLRTRVLAFPLLLALCGCAAAPLVEAAASGSGNSGLASMIKQVVPGMGGDTTSPCTARPAAPGNDCGESTHHVATSQATTEQVAADTQSPACDQNISDTSNSGCVQGNAAALLQGLAGSLQKLVPGSSLPR